MDFEKEYNLELNRRLNMNSTSIDEMRVELKKHEETELKHFYIILISIISIIVLGNTYALPTIIKAILIFIK